MARNATEEKPETGVKPYKEVTFEDYITWRALGGLLIDESDPYTPNKVRIMSLDEFCTTFDVSRQTIWRWKNQTPDLAARIEKRRAEIMPLARVGAAWNQLFLNGMQTKDRRAAVDALKTFLGHFGNLQLPTQRTEVDAGQNLLDLVNAARKKNIIEGEPVDRPTANTGSSA